MQVHENLFVNSNFDVWPEGTEFVNAQSWTHFAGVHQFNKSGTLTCTVSRSSDSPPVSLTGRLSNYTAKITCTTGQSNLGATDYAEFEAFVEGEQFQSIANQPFTLSLPVKSSVPGTYSVTAINTGEDRCCTIEYTVNEADKWEWKHLTFPASPSSGQWDYAKGLGVKFRFPLACGSDYRTSPGLWKSGNFIASTNQTNFCSAANSTFCFGQLFVSPALVVERYSPISCYNLSRYVPFWKASSALQPIGSCHAFSTTAGYAMLDIDTRVPLTGITVSSVTHFGMVPANASAMKPTTNLIFNASSESMLTLVSTIGTADLSVGQAGPFWINNSSALLIGNGARLKSAADS